MATKAAKSITINATKFELANALDVANGKLQLKAKDVVLDEVEVKAGASWITLTAEFDNGQYIIRTIDCSDDIEPTTYTAMDLYNDWSKGDLKVVFKVGNKCYLVDQVEHSVDDEGEETHYITITSGGTYMTPSGDKLVYLFYPQALVGTETINVLTTTKKDLYKWTKICNW